MTKCFKCRKILPGKFDPTELVLCRECAKWLNPNHLKIKVPKFDEETIKKLSPKVEKKKVL